MGKNWANKAKMIGAAFGGGVPTMIIFCALIIGMSYADDLRMVASLFLGYFYFWFLAYVDKEYEDSEKKR